MFGRDGLQGALTKLLVFLRACLPKSLPVNLSKQLSTVEDLAWRIDMCSKLRLEESISRHCPQKARFVFVASEKKMSEENAEPTLNNQSSRCPSHKLRMRPTHHLKLGMTMSQMGEPSKTSGSPFCDTILPKRVPSKDRRTKTWPEANHRPL